MKFSLSEKQVSLICILTSVCLMIVLISLSLAALACGEEEEIKYPVDWECCLIT